MENQEGEQKSSFTPELRERVKSCLNEMHELMRKGYDA